MKMNDEQLDEIGKFLSDDTQLPTIVDEHSQQLKEIADILKRLTKEMNANRSLITKCSDVTGALVKTINLMNDNQRLRNQ